MTNISEHDKRQLELMYKNVIYFEKKQITLTSLIGSLEFLLNAFESIDNDWEEELLDEITTLETINALDIIKEAGEKTQEIDENKKKQLIQTAIVTIKKIINKKLN